MFLHVRFQLYIMNCHLRAYCLLPEVMLACAIPVRLNFFILAILFPYSHFHYSTPSDYFYYFSHTLRFILLFDLRILFLPPPPSLLSLLLFRPSFIFLSHSHPSFVLLFVFRISFTSFFPSFFIFIISFHFLLLLLLYLSYIIHIIILLLLVSSISFTSSPLSYFI